MTIEIDRRTLLQMLAAGLAGGPVLASSPFAFAQNADAVTIGWPQRRAIMGSQPALHAGCAADLQAGLRPAARPEPEARAHAEADHASGSLRPTA